MSNMERVVILSQKTTLTRDEIDRTERDRLWWKERYRYSDYLFDFAFLALPASISLGFFYPEWFTMTAWAAITCLYAGVRKEKARREMEVLLFRRGQLVEEFINERDSERSSL